MPPVGPAATAGDGAGPDLALAPHGDTWFDLSDAPLPLAEVHTWVVLPECGGSVVFTGTARNHAEGRSGVTLLEYEAYAEHVLVAFEKVAAAARHHWPTVGRIAILHRTGPLEVTEAAVVVGVSAPHRQEAFDAARFCIDEVKATAPIWKREHWSGGVDWGHCDGDAPPADGAWVDASGGAEAPR